MTQPMILIILNFDKLNKYYLAEMELKIWAWMITAVSLLKVYGKTSMFFCHFIKGNNFCDFQWAFPDDKPIQSGVKS